MGVNLKLSKEKKLLIKSLIIILFLVFHISGCYYDSHEYLFPELGSQCDTTNVAFSGAIAPMISSYCLSCHSNSTAASYGANIKLENYSDIILRVNDGKLYGAISHTSAYSPMPKSSAQLSDCIITSVKIWIDAGAPNN